MTTRARILLVEDETAIASFIEKALQYEGYDVLVAHDGMHGLMAAQRHEPDLVILDRMLPLLDGLEVCRRLRQSSQIPVLMLTAKTEIGDRVAGLDHGANDYLCKPFDLRELLARVRTQLRHANRPERPVLTFADLWLEHTERAVKRGDRPIALTPKEFELLTYLLRHPRQVLTRSQILEAVWGWDFEGDSNILDVYIRYLRLKLERDGDPRLIHTVHGIGYVLRDTP